MKVENFTSHAGNKVANQFIITDNDGICPVRYFQSYSSMIAKISVKPGGGRKVELDEDRPHHDAAGLPTAFRPHRRRVLADAAAGGSRNHDAGGLRQLGAERHRLPLRRRVRG